ncbi:restriction endonuclease subunit S [Spiroplasma endosymbiont of Cantharis rufa]|uniref:restriction endonuclease subunit S n=1 Tax=Spiroplasma endosymbiont of Cantharis rufa TaxID=3066279 RepID=UPI0030CB60B2
MKITKITEIFNISVGTNIDYISTIETTNKPILYVSRKTGKNGVKDIVEKSISIIPNKKFSISVPLGGNGRLTAYLQPYEYYSGQNIFILTPKQSMSTQMLLYYCLIIRKNSFKYSAFGREANTTFASLNVPDMNSLPKYINNLEIIDLLNIKHSFTNIETFDRYVNSMLKPVKWKMFNLLDIFNIKNGKNISEEIAKNLEKGNVSFVSTTEKNNGIKYKIDIDSTMATIYESGYLSLAKNGNVGQVFYQDNPFVKTSDVLVLQCKYKKLLLAEGLFFKYMIEKSKIKFNYGRKITADRIKQVKFKLPITYNEEPDFILIDNFVKNFKELTNFL